MPRTLSVIRNTTLSYVGQAYALLVGILIMPFYLGHLGAEAYGLIGFFSVMQAWLQLLDAGLSPSLVRAVAHQQGLANQEHSAGHLLRSFEIMFLPMAVICTSAIYAASPWIAAKWLNAQTLDLETLISCISMMGVIIALRLYATLYKSGIQGLEQHAWLNIANVIIATLRYFGGLVLVSTLSQDPRDFFEFQIMVGLIEALIFGARAYQQIPAPHFFSGFNWSLVKPIIPFAASMSLTTVLWIVLTQMDKVLLSEMLLLKEYGYFSLVALITTGILMLANPLAQTLLPRLTVLVAEGREGDMHTLFLGASRFVCTLLFPLAAVIGFHAESLIFAWTGDPVAAHWSRSILLWYALGSAIMAASSFQFYLQYAYAKLHLHVWYSVVSAIVTVPAMVLAIHYQGAYGAALAWFGLRLVSFFVWPSIVHNRFAPGVHGLWVHDIVRITLMTAIGIAVSEPLLRMIAGEDRFTTLLGLAVSGFITLMLVTMSYKPLAVKLYVLLSKPST
ncbi:oligosaccharide flippase family protein [Pseudomonas sp. 10B1]|uniref:lipopolysaccharide biosynthesis protein n=1 Tax=unclassified Pseudomonas TaxID=196821 RepID=UPI002AB5520C|nr:MULTISPECIES: oligosaccharide flippase family protein [unclassified Pseudomonas]MDY7559573.1 oligosaccharide flippase family protein [Pseudomonas sp. AB6]MEA9977518.1 oligosaccharide flippase family protein [Pseudomonas sp. RTS4]MEA9996427.1 oligosaccharide flippase family protein [Pseudomonas sp. AA4]MEB0089423.1 oligosaccharide flippase family protein [Pseudomonas sp. RTI1]MEB0126897.1 oligosaccharide flippase family protein [Pseudomonas sp. CCC1.2]